MTQGTLVAVLGVIVPVPSSFENPINETPTVFPWGNGGNSASDSLQGRLAVI